MAPEAGGDEGAGAQAASPATTRQGSARPSGDAGQDLAEHLQVRAGPSIAEGSLTQEVRVNSVSSVANRAADACTPAPTTALPSTSPPTSTSRLPSIISYNSNRDTLHHRRPVRNSGLIVKEMMSIDILRNARARVQATQQVINAKPDIIAFYLAGTRSRTHADYRGILAGIDCLCKQQHDEGGHCMIYANESTRTWNDIEALELPAWQVTNANGVLHRATSSREYQTGEYAHQGHHQLRSTPRRAGTLLLRHSAIRRSRLQEYRRRHRLIVGYMLTGVREVSAGQILVR